MISLFGDCKVEETNTELGAASCEQCIIRSEGQRFVWMRPVDTVRLRVEHLINVCVKKSVVVVVFVVAVVVINTVGVVVFVVVHIITVAIASTVVLIILTITTIIIVVINL